MKAKREHRASLCRRAAQILDAARTFGNGGALIFPGVRGNRLSDIRLSKLLKDLEVGSVPHGFRSSFRDWAAEESNHPREEVEAALAHAVQNNVEAAYARSDLFERRRRLMNDWSAYLGGGAGTPTDDRPSVEAADPRPRARRGGDLNEQQRAQLPNRARKSRIGIFNRLRKPLWGCRDGKCCSRSSPVVTTRRRWQLWPRDG